MLRFFIILLNCLLISLLVNLTYANLSPQHIQQLKQQAKQGDADAQLELGNYELTNNHYRQAHKWFEKLSKQDDSDSQSRGLGGLGLLYILDQGPYSKNYKQAKNYFQRAVKKGYKKGYSALGLIYYNGGHGVKKDIKKAKHYYRLGIKHKSNEAMFNLANLYAHQNQYKQAFHWYHQAAKQYDLRGMLQTGLAYSLGKGVSKNKAQACKWLRLTLKVYPNYETGQEMLTSVENELGYLQQRACDKAYHKYLKHHDVPRKSDFKARLELKG